MDRPELLKNVTDKPFWYTVTYDTPLPSFKNKINETISAGKQSLMYRFEEIKKVNDGGKKKTKKQKNKKTKKQKNKKTKKQKNIKTKKQKNKKTKKQKNIAFYHFFFQLKR
jgi:hypothetical protein